jgi:hypothetical protein
MMRGFLTFCCVSRSEVFAKNVSAFAENISVYFFGGHGDSRNSPTSFTALLASNLLAQFSHQIVIQILGLESPKVCGNLAVRPHFKNNFDDVIQVLDGQVEDLEALPGGVKEVDIIISEWMGYCLLYEQMLPSVIHARDKFKAKMMLPNLAQISICGFADADYHSSRTAWTSTSPYGVKMTSCKADICSTIWTETCPSDVIITTSYKVANLDLYTVIEDKCCTVFSPFELKLMYPGAENIIHGLVVYFEVFFDEGRNKLVLTNSPHPPECGTHWQQSICLFEVYFFCLRPEGPQTLE